MVGRPVLTMRLLPMGMLSVLTLDECICLTWERKNAGLCTTFAPAALCIFCALVCTLVFRISLVGVGFLCPYEHTQIAAASARRSPCRSHESWLHRIFVVKNVHFLIGENEHVVLVLERKLVQECRQEKLAVLATRLFGRTACSQQI